MKWLYTFKHRVKAAFLLAIIVLLVSTKNIWDKSNVVELGNSFSSVYEDRLLVESYIYALSDHLYRKQIGMETCDESATRDNTQARNNAIASILTDYEKTKFTAEEHLHFTQLKLHIHEMINIEAQSAGDAGLPDPAKKELDTQFTAAINDLHHLSAIQVLEGKVLNDNSRKIMAGSALLTRFELVVLICIGLLIQAMIFTSNSFTPKMPQRSDLN
jgi:oligoribonuclease (3'-5' exoribonuclease)